MLIPAFPLVIDLLFLTQNFPHKSSWEFSGYPGDGSSTRAYSLCLPVSPLREPLCGFVDEKLFSEYCSKRPHGKSPEAFDLHWHGEKFESRVWHALQAAEVLDNRDVRA